MSTDLLFIADIIPGGHLPLWTRHKSFDSDSFKQEFDQECHLVSSCLVNHIQRCITDGKSLIVEGVHITNHLLSALVSHSGQSPLVIPFMFQVDKRLHAEIVCNWVARQLPSHVNSIDQPLDNLVDSFQAMQEQMNMNLNDQFIRQTVNSNCLNSIHETVLSRIMNHKPLSD